MTTYMDTLTARLSARRSLPPASMRRAIRKAAGASLQDVANAFEPPISRFTVRAWEDGTRNPGPDNVEQYAVVLRALQGL